MAQATKTSMTGTRKAAVVLASLPNETASRVLSRLDPKEAEAVSVEIALLADLPESAAEETLREFVDTSRSGGPVLYDGLAHARELLRKALSAEQADEAVSRLEQAAGRRPFDFLASADPDEIIACIRDEQPQTMALVLAHVAPAKAAAALASLPADVQGEVVRRIARLREVAPETLQRVEEALAGRTGGAGTTPAIRAGGVERAAEILRRAGSRIERTALDELEDADPELADDLRKRLFAFEDLLRADDRGIRALLKEVSTQEVSVALKTASEDLREKFLSNMSRRARELLIEDMDYMRPVRLTEVEAAQMRMLDAARRLEDNGELFVAGRASGEEYIA